jgi:hypothetical protein
MQLKVTRKHGHHEDAIIGWAQWLVSVILVAQEAEIRRIMV